MRFKGLLISFILLAGCSANNINNSVPITSAPEKTAEINQIKKTPIDPCLVLTKEDAEYVLGSGKKVEFDSRESTKPGTFMKGQKICYYSNPSNDDFIFAQIALIDPNEYSGSVKTLFSEMKEIYGKDIEEIQGIGTSAFHSTGFAGGLDVYDEVSNVSFKISFASGFGKKPTSADRERQDTMAKKIVDRLRLMVK